MTRSLQRARRCSTGRLFSFRAALCRNCPNSAASAADAAETPKGLRGPTPGRLPDPAPRDNPSQRSGPARNDLPKSGQPSAAPTTKGPLPPYGLTESKSPATQKSAPSTESKPAGEPATTTARAPSSAPSYGTPSAPDSPTAGAGHPASGGASGYLPKSPVFDHHGPVAHDGDHSAMAGPLTSRDLSALADYTGIGHEDLNDSLRTNTMDASQQARVDALNQALEKLPPHRGPVVRGTDLPPEALARYQPDAVVTERAFLSTAEGAGVARSTAFAGNVEFRIFSKTGRDISSYSTFPTEREVLFPSGTKFYVVDRKFDPVMGRTIIEMIER